MKRMKTLSILLVMVMTLSLANVSVFAAEEDFIAVGAILQDTDSSTTVGGDVFAHVENGTISVNYPLHPSKEVIEVIFTPDAGLGLVSSDMKSSTRFEVLGTTVTCVPAIVGETIVYTMTMSVDGAISYFEIGAWETVIDLDGYNLRVGEMTNDTGWFNPELKWFFAVHVVFGDVPEPEPQQPAPLYTVRVESNPAGIATFAGYGTGFSDGESYNVSIASSDPSYQFTGWAGSPSGTIAGSDVGLTANFELIAQEIEEEVIPEDLEVRYDVTAVSQPAGVGTYTGQGSFVNGDSYKVQVASIMDGYEFVRWDTPYTGVMDGADVEVVAVYAAIVEEPEVVVPEVVEPEEVLDEEVVPEEQPETLPETSGIPFAGFVGMGSMISGLGFVIRKKK